MAAFDRRQRSPGAASGEPPSPERDPLGDRRLALALARRGATRRASASSATEAPVSQPGDAVEREADSVSKQVAAQLHDGAPGPAPQVHERSAGISRQVMLQRDDESAKEEATEEVAEDKAANRAISPATVDQLIRDTDSIHMLVERQMKSGLKADGMTFLYQSEEEYARGLSRHLVRVVTDPKTFEVRTKTDEEVLEEARALASDSVARTAPDGTIHVNTTADGFSWRTTLHEAMHQQMRGGAEFGFELNEGLAEWLSQIILENHGISFEPYGPYVRAYRFAERMATIFGEDLLERVALDGGLQLLSKEFTTWAPPDRWNDLTRALVSNDLDAAGKVLDWYEALKAMGEPAEKEAEQASDAFAQENDEREEELNDEHEQGAWPPEAKEPIETTMLSLGKHPLGTKVTLPKGGQHGVRKGWTLEAPVDSTYYPARYILFDVETHTSWVAVPIPLEELQALADSPIKLYPATPNVSMKL